LLMCCGWGSTGPAEAGGAAGAGHCAKDTTVGGECQGGTLGIPFGKLGISAEGGNRQPLHSEKTHGASWHVEASHHSEWKRPPHPSSPQTSPPSFRPERSAAEWSRGIPSSASSTTPKSVTVFPGRSRATRNLAQDTPAAIIPSAAQRRWCALLEVDDDVEGLGQDGGHGGRGHIVSIIPPTYTPEPARLLEPITYHLVEGCRT